MFPVDCFPPHQTRVGQWNPIAVVFLFLLPGKTPVVKIKVSDVWIQMLVFSDLKTDARKGRF